MLQRPQVKLVGEGNRNEEPWQAVSILCVKKKLLIIHADLDSLAIFAPVVWGTWTENRKGYFAVLDTKKEH